MYPRGRLAVVVDEEYLTLRRDGHFPARRQGWHRAARGGEGRLLRLRRHGDRGRRRDH